MAKHLSDICQTLVEHLSNIYQTIGIRSSEFVRRNRSVETSRSKDVGRKGQSKKVCRNRSGVGIQPRRTVNQELDNGNFEPSLCRRRTLRAGNFEVSRRKSVEIGLESESSRGELSIRGWMMAILSLVPVGEGK